MHCLVPLNQLIQFLAVCLKDLSKSVDGAIDVLPDSYQTSRTFQSFEVTNCVLQVQSPGIYLVAAGKNEERERG